MNNFHDFRHELNAPRQDAGGLWSQWVTYPAFREFHVDGILDRIFQPGRNPAVMHVAKHTPWWTRAPSTLLRTFLIHELHHFDYHFQDLGHEHMNDLYSF